jgi:hypothetical protein
MMKLWSIALSGAALLALAACGESKVETATPEAGKEVDISIASAGADSAGSDAEEGALNNDANTDTGKFELKLPGGIEANVKVPGGMVDKADFDIDGVGLYPGAKVGSVNVKALSGKGQGNGSATVRIGFSAPADAAAVADWYQQQFEAKKVPVTRRGETLSGKTEDGDDFTLTVARDGAGASKGELTIIDAG